MPAKLAETLGLTDTIRAIPITEPEAVQTIGLVVPSREPMMPITAALVEEAQARGAAAPGTIARRTRQPSRYATFTSMCRNMALRASSSNSVLNLCLVLELVGALRRRTCADLVDQPLQIGELRPGSPRRATIGIRRAQPHTAMSTIV